MSFITMIVDDDPIICRLHTKVVEYAGFGSTVICFKHGLEAVNFLHDNYQANSRYVIFLDLNMPVMDGWEFLEAVQMLYPGNNIKIIITTSSPRKADLKRAELYSHVCLFLEKPLTTAKLKEWNGTSFLDHTGTT